MGDSEEMDIFWQSWISPVKRHRNKDKKCKYDKTMKTDNVIQKKKKKKHSKFKDAMVVRKAKTKEKKKKKNRSALEQGGSFIVTEANNAQAKPAVKPETSNPRSNDKLKPDHLMQDSKRKPKRIKKVGFDLSQGYIPVKHPKIVSSSPRCPKDSIPFENEGRGPTHHDDSQCTSEDANSQDLFITQKTFRASLSQPSSGEASDKAITATPQMFTQRVEPHTPVAEIKRHLDRSYKCPQDSRFLQKPKAAQVVLTEEEEEINKGHDKHEMETLSFETQMEMNGNLTRKKKASCPVRMKPSEVNPYLAEPTDVKPPLDVGKSKKHSCTSSQQSMTSASTQTENLFTTELSLYLNFCQKPRAVTHFGKPLDLSLPDRARKDLGTCLSVKTSSLPGQIKDDNHKDLDLHPPCSSGMKCEKTESSGPHPWSASTREKGEMSLSLQSESEPKSADTTTSSEDNEPPCRPGKLDLTQVRAVQMRLNESFFFKTKGEGQSPRPESPLMKLAQSRDVKSRKGH